MSTILEGELTARIGAAAHAMKAGDYVCFPAGQKAGHCLVNESAAPCRYVIVGERNPDEVVVYTDSNKVLVRSLGRRAIYDLAARRGYWDGEDTGLAAGEAVPPDTAEDGPEAPALPKPPIAADAVPWEATSAGERFGGRARHLTHAAVGAHYQVGMLVEAPAPGKRLAPLHYHMLEEEHALILDGQVRLLLGEERHELRAGDYVCFPAGRKIGHSFLNSGTGPCSYLMIGERNPNEVCVYPDFEQAGGRRPAHQGQHLRHGGVAELLGRRADRLSRLARRGADAGDQDVDQIPGAVRPVGTAADVGHARQRPQQVQRLDLDAGGTTRHRAVDQQRHRFPAPTRSSWSRARPGRRGGRAAIRPCCAW